MFVHAQEYPINPNDTYPRKYIQNSLTRTQASLMNLSQWRAGPDATSSQGFSLEKMGAGKPWGGGSSLVVSGAIVGVHRLWLLVVYHLHGQTSRFTVWANGK